MVNCGNCASTSLSYVVEVRLLFLGRYSFYNLHGSSPSDSP